MWILTSIRQRILQHYHLIILVISVAKYSPRKWAAEIIVMLYIFKSAIRVNFVGKSFLIKEQNEDTRVSAWLSLDSHLPDEYRRHVHSDVFFFLTEVFIVLLSYLKRPRLSRKLPNIFIYNCCLETLDPAEPVHKDCQ